MRGIIDDATGGLATNVHVNSVSEALRAIREKSATSLLLSPSIARNYPLPEVQRLLSKSPGVTAIAVLAGDWPASHDALLGLGACGVRQAVNLGDRDGWQRLRCIVDDAGGDFGQPILCAVLDMTIDASDEMRKFLATLVRVGPAITTVRALSTRLEVEPSTLISRFFRAGLPAPRKYLSMTRLLYAASYLGMPRVSVAATADALHYSSPQSFGRHVRTVLGLTAGEFRRELSLSDALSHYRDRLIEPYREILCSFNPIERRKA